MRNDVRPEMCRIAVAAAVVALAFAGPAAAGDEHSMHAQHEHQHQHAQHQHAQHQNEQHQHEQHAGHHAQHQGHADMAGADPHAAHRAAMAKPSGASSLRVELPEAVLLDQDGRRLDFRRELLGDKVVILDFIYTTCTTVCPVQSAIFSELQQRLADRLGDSVALVSLSVDPQRDTPARMKGAATKYGAGPGWSWITGERAAVEDVLRAYGAYTPNYADHPPLIVVGDAVTGKWTRFFGFPDIERILESVDQALLARGSAALAKVR